MTLGAGLRDRAAIVGIGETEHSKESGRTELALACEAITKAVGDAGLTVADIDGLVRFEMDSVDEVALTSHLGLVNLGWMSQTGYGGTGGNAVIVHAAAAIAAGLASTVVCYRARNERSGQRYGRGATWMSQSVGGFQAFQMPWGMLTPAHAFGQFARRHMIEYGTTSEHFGHVAVALRRHGSRNPRAMMRTPITLADHRGSRMIADPLRLLDCCSASDGAGAVIGTAAERARGLARPPVWIMGAAQGSGTQAVGIVFRDSLATAESTHTARDVYRSAGRGPAEIDAVMIYDHFTPFVIFSLEAYGFCEPGEGGPFVEGGRIELDGALPVNTHGGNHSEAYIHGLPHAIEAVRQFRGTSSSQIEGPELILSCSSVAQLSAAVILRRDRRADRHAATAPRPRHEAVLGGLRRGPVDRPALPSLRPSALAAGADVPRLSVDRHRMGGVLGPRQRVQLGRRHAPGRRRARRPGSVCDRDDRSSRGRAHRRQRRTLPPAGRHRRHGGRAVVLRAGRGRHRDPSFCARDQATTER